MNNFETRILDARLTEVPDSLDRSIEQMVRWAEVEQSTQGVFRKPLWFAVAGCAAGLLVGILLGPLVHGGGEIPTKPTTTVVVVEPTPELERWLTPSSRRRQQGFFERTHGELETVFVAGEPSDKLPNSL